MYEAVVWFGLAVYAGSQFSEFYNLIRKRI